MEIFKWSEAVCCQSREHCDIQQCSSRWASPLDRWIPVTLGDTIHTGLHRLNQKSKRWSNGSAFRQHVKLETQAEGHNRAFYCVWAQATAQDIYYVSLYMTSNTTAERRATLVCVFACVVGERTRRRTALKDLLLESFLARRQRYIANTVWLQVLLNSIQYVSISACILHTMQRSLKRKFDF